MARDWGFRAMSTRRWITFVNVVAPAMTAFILLRRGVAARVASYLREGRLDLGLPPDAPLGDFNIPVTKEIAFWIDLDTYLSRFSVAIAALIILSSYGLVASFPRRGRKPNVPPVPLGSRDTRLVIGSWIQGGPATVRGLDFAQQPYVGGGRQFGGLHPHGACVAMADGSVRWVKDSINPGVFEAMSTMGGGERLTADR